MLFRKRHFAEVGGVPKIKVRQFVAFTIQLMLTIMRSAGESRLL